MFLDSKSVTDPASLAQRLSSMHPGAIFSETQFAYIDGSGNRVDLRNVSILCRERHSTKNSGKVKQPGYRFEVFSNIRLGEGEFGEVFPIIATLKLNERGDIVILKKEKQRIVKIEFPRQDERGCAENEALFGMTIPYLHMKPLIKKTEVLDGENQIRRYLVMRRMPGATLFDLLKNGNLRSLSQARKFLLLLSLLEALQSLHQQGLIHGDIKNDNIMVDDDLENPKPQVNIIDFGLCSLAKDKDRRYGGDIFFMGEIFREIDKFAEINDPALNQLINSMKAKYEQRISLEKAIVKVKGMYLRLMPEEPSSLVNLQLPLLINLSHNKAFATLLKKYSLTKQELINWEQKISDPSEARKIDFADLNRKLNLIEVLDFFATSQNTRLGAILIDAFYLSVNLDNQSEDKNFRVLRQSILQAIFTYVQTYRSGSQDRIASTRRINNIKTLLIILENSNSIETLKSKIIDWRQAIERGALGRSKLYDLVAEAAGLENKTIINKNSFWSRLTLEPSPQKESFSTYYYLQPRF